MDYILKHYEEPIMYFQMENTFEGLCISSIRVVESKRSLLPLDLEVSEDGIENWLKKRTIPRNRAYVTNFLSKLGLNERDTKGIIDISKGLSLNDCYWIVQAGDTSTFAKKNLYTNSFNTNIASIAFTGYGSYTKSSFKRSPEFTTNGMLAKSWRRMGGKIYLFKCGTEGFANSGLEPFSELYASQIAEKMNLNHVSYDLNKWKKRICSSCELFTSLDIGFVPIGRIVKTGGILKVIEFYKNISEEAYQDLLDMLVFDAIILNEDRHFGNFGVLINNHTNEIIGMAPIFDNGLSLLCYAMEQDDFEEYAKTRLPATYDDFIGFIQPLMTKRQKEKVRSMIDFTFDTNTRYKLPNKRLKALERIIHQQVLLLLDHN